MAAVEARMAHGCDAAERLRSDAEIRSVARRAFGVLETSAPEWLDTAPLFRENAAWAEPPEPLPDAVAEDLRDVALRLSPNVFRAPAYTTLVEHFVGRYGPAGRCDDILEFLYSFMARPDFTRVVQQPPQDPARPGDHPGGCGTLAPVTHAVFFQLAAADRTAMRRGEYRLVLNKINSGSAGMLARWAGLDHLRPTIDTATSDWLAGLHPGHVVHQISAGADWAGIQRPPVTVPRLLWPSDLPDGRPGLPLTSLHLIHDVASGTLQARDHQGRRTALSYLGVTPTHRLTGAIRLLLLIADPWISLFRVDNERRPFDPPEPIHDRVVRMPRAQVGRVVYARERWRLPTSLFPRPKSGETTPRYLGRLDQWRRTNRIPLEVFVHLHEGQQSLTNRKPMWMAFDSPYSIWAVHRALTDTTVTVDLVEALPARREHWYRDRDGAVRATEMMALVRHV
jgi:hypothetical protein